MRRDEMDPQPPPATTKGVEPEALLLSVAHTIADSIVTTDDDLLITMWTGGAQETFGWTADEVLGRPLTILMPARYVEAHLAGVGRVRDGDMPRLVGQGVVPVEGVRKDGSEFPAELTLTSGSHAGQRFFAAVIRDVSARASAESGRLAALDELARTNVELQRFASIASHDLNEPLRIVDGYLQLLGRRYGPVLDDTGREFIAHAVNAVSRMQQLIDDLLRYARAGAVEAERTPVDLGVVAREARDALAPAIDETGATVTIDQLPTVRGDASLLRQVLQNLLGNALKYRRIDVAPLIDVRATHDDDHWTIEVTDNGLGIDPRIAERLFDMFERGAGEARERAGSGIGLAIVKRAAEAHGGRAAVRPRPDGTPGSCFTVTLPDREAG